MNKKLKLLGVAAAMSLSVNAQAAIIDLFSIPQNINDNTADATAVTATVTDAADPGSIIGGVRDISVNLINDTNPSTANMVEMDIFGGILSFSNDNGAGGEGIVQWDATPGLALNMTGLGGIDLRADGSNAFVYEVLSVDLGFQISIEVYTDATHWTKALIQTDNVGVDTIPFVNLENAALCGNVPPPIGSLLAVTCGAAGPADLSSVGALQTILNVSGGTLAVDLSIRNITTQVPEPATIALLGAGLVGAGFAGRRRKSVK